MSKSMKLSGKKSMKSSAKKTGKSSAKKIVKASGKKIVKSATKTMKTAKKTTKTTKRAKKGSKVARGKLAKYVVFQGRKERTVSGITKDLLTKNKNGKVVSKKAQAAGRKAFKRNGIEKFTKALMQARKALGIKGFVPTGGKTPAGQALLKKTRSLMKAQR